jgi:hypothetical protein
VTSRQLLTWLDGRNGSTFDQLTWDGSALSFDITVAAGAEGITALLPLDNASGPLSSVSRNGADVTYTQQTIKGVPYAVFEAAPGSYRAVYGTSGSVSAATTSPVALDALGLEPLRTRPVRRSRRRRQP